MNSDFERVLESLCRHSNVEAAVPHSVAGLSWARLPAGAIKELPYVESDSAFLSSFRWFVADDDGGRAIVLVGCGATALLIAVPEIHWIGPTEPRMVPGWTRIVSVDWPTSEAWRWVAEAARRRRSSFRRCSVCDVLVAPEGRLGAECHSCMEARGVVF